MHWWCNSRRQLLNCLADGATKVDPPPPVQTLVEGSADVSVEQPEFNVIQLVDHLVLGAFQTTIDRRGTRRRLTLIIARIKLTVPKTALAEVIPGSSFARFKASMATFNANISLSPPLSGWDSASMVGNRVSCERTVRREGCGGFQTRVK